MNHNVIKLMNFHVPSQSASGDLVSIEYFNIDDGLVKTEEKAKPLINVYVYGSVSASKTRKPRVLPAMVDVKPMVR